jgi:hypothetical protein
MTLARNGTEATIYILPDGATEFRLDDVESGRYLEDVSGLGMPGVSHVTRQGYNQDGATWLATRLNPRVISLTVAQVYPDRAAMWAGHRDWFAAFAPGDDGGTLRKVLPDGTAYELDVRFQGGMDAGSTERFGRRVQTYALQLVAHRPVWRAVTPTTWTLERGAGGGLSFPVSFPISFVSGDLMGRLAIAYGGSYRTWPTISLAGPLTGPKLVHETLGVVIELDYTVGLGEVVTLALDPVAPLATNGAGTNLVSYLGDTSDLAGFYLAVGANAIRLSATGTADESAMALSYYEQFLGV